MDPIAMLQPRLVPPLVWQAQKHRGLKVKSRKSHGWSSIHSQTSHRIIGLGGRPVFFLGILFDDSILRIGHCGGRLGGERIFSRQVMNDRPTRRKALEGSPSKRTSVWPMTGSSLEQPPMEGPEGAPSVVRLDGSVDESPADGRYAPSLGQGMGGGLGVQQGLSALRVNFVSVRGISLSFDRVWAVTRTHESLRHV